MAAINQDNLSSMVSSVKSALTTYETSLNSAVGKLLAAFNESWVSDEAQSLATEVAGCVTSLVTNIATTMDSKDAAIKAAVNGFNLDEGTNITYSGFSPAPTPSVNLTLNDKLPNGKVGVADNADLTTIETPMDTLVTDVNSVLSTLESTVSQADAFDDVSATALSDSFTSIKNTFKNGMDGLKESFRTRMSGEISKRDAGDTIIRASLGA